jgi:hypothetical protein
VQYAAQMADCVNDWLLDKQKARQIAQLHPATMTVRLWLTVCCAGPDREGGLVIGDRCAVHSSKRHSV